MPIYRSRVDGKRSAVCFQWVDESRRTGSQSLTRPTFWGYFTDGKSSPTREIFTLHERNIFLPREKFSKPTNHLLLSRMNLFCLLSGKCSAITVHIDIVFFCLLCSSHKSHKPFSIHPYYSLNLLFLLYYYINIRACSLAHDNQP